MHFGGLTIREDLPHRVRGRHACRLHGHRAYRVRGRHACRLHGHRAYRVRGRHACRLHGHRAHGHERQMHPLL